MLVANHLLSLSSAQVSARQLDTAITVLLLLPSDIDFHRAYAGLRKHRYRIDSKLVTDLLKTTRSMEVKRCIVLSLAFAHLPKHLYRRLFKQFWRRRRDVRWRWALGESLPLFLQDNPAEGRFYASAIWRIAFDADESLALRGLSCTGFLGNALTLRQARTLIVLTTVGSDKAISTLSNLGRLYQHLEDLRSPVRALLLDSKTIATLRDSSNDPPDDFSYGDARRFCLAQVRKALGRVRAGRVPAAVK